VKFQKPVPGIEVRIHPHRHSSVQEGAQGGRKDPRFHFVRASKSIQTKEEISLFGNSFR